MRARRRADGAGRTVSVRLSPAEGRAVDAAAETRGQARSDLIRACLGLTGTGIERREIADEILTALGVLARGRE